MDSPEQGETFGLGPVVQDPAQRVDVALGQIVREEVAGDDFDPAGGR